MDDEVVREVDVYVTSELELYLLQFPLKPVYADSIDVTSAKFKPEHKKLELEVPVTLPSNHHPDVNIRNLPTTQNYTSSVVTQDCCLGAGIVKDGSFFITPIKNVLQLRPSFKNLQSFRGEVVEELKDDETDGPDAGSDNIQHVQLKRKESERAQSAREQSFAYIQAQEDAESWRLLKVHEIGTHYIHCSLFL